MIVIAGLAVVAQAKVSHEALNRDWLNPIDLGKNLLLIQEWGPNPQRGWNFVAWSLSMEWLAYLLFPLLALVIWLLYRRAATAIIAVLWVAVLVPLVVYGLGRSDSYYTDHWGSTIRILTEFSAGALTYVIVRRFMPDAAADPGARVEPLPPYFHLLLVPLLIAWIGALALSRRGLARFLSTRTLVLGGFISYSLYMTHLVWFGLWKAGMSKAHITSGALYDISVVALVAGALVIAWLMWRFVEEPAREWMRTIVGARRTPTEEAGEAMAPRAGAEPTSVPDVPTDPIPPQR